MYTSSSQLLKDGASQHQLFGLLRNRHCIKAERLFPLCIIHRLGPCSCGTRIFVTVITKGPTHETFLIQLHPFNFAQLLSLFCTAIRGGVVIACVWIMNTVYSFIPQSALRDFSSLFQNQFYTECDIVLHISISRIFSFP